MTGGINSTEYSQCFITDGNIDSNTAINILDVIQLINLALGFSRSVETNLDNYAVAQLSYDKNDLLLRIESGSDVAGIQMNIDSERYYTIELKDNSHIESFSRYHSDSMNIVSFNSFNEPFDGLSLIHI